MARERTNMGPESIKVKQGASAQVSMKLPREDDGKVHPACGELSNTSAARYADAVASLPGEGLGKKFTQDSGR